VPKSTSIRASGSSRGRDQVLKDRTQASTTRTAKERRLELIFVGDDRSEEHHDICILDEKGRVLARRQLPEGVAGVAGFHELVGDLAPISASGN